MKAKVKETGEVVEVCFGSDDNYHRIVRFEVDRYRPDDIELIDIDITPQKQSVTIEGWIARDKDNTLRLYQWKPKRVDGENIWFNSLETCDWMEIDSYLFPDLKWEDKPRKVKIIIEEV